MGIQYKSYLIALICNTSIPAVQKIVGFRAQSFSLPIIHIEMYFHMHKYIYKALLRICDDSFCWFVFNINNCMNKQFANIANFLFFLI